MTDKHLQNIVREATSAAVLSDARRASVQFLLTGLVENPDPDEVAEDLIEAWDMNSAEFMAFAFTALLHVQTLVADVHKRMKELEEAKRNT